MIYAVTLNPSTDYIVRIDGLKLGDLGRMRGGFKLPGGKGVSVSHILKWIDPQSTALGFLGRFTDKFISKWLEKEQIQSLSTTVKEDTRISIKLKSDIETEINDLGPSISDEKIDKLEQALGTVEQGDIVALSGSAPANLRKEFYRELIDIIREKDADFVVDITGDNLENALVKKPLLVKPNNHELAELYSTTLQSVEEIIPYGKKLLAEEAQNVLASMAGGGALLFTEQGTYKTSVLVRPLKSSAGARDSTIAGFIGIYSRTKDPIKAFKWGVACGSATTFSDGLATRELVGELLPKIEITKID